MDQKVNSKTYIAIFTVIILSFTGILTETSMNVTYLELSKEFSVSLGFVQWVTTGYLLMVTIIMGTTSYLLKRFQARYIQLFAAISFTIGDLMCALAPSFPIMLIGRLLQAASTGLATPIMFHIIFTQIPRNKIASMTGIAGMVISFAPALGPTYGGIISSTMSWRMIFWIVLPLSLISLVMGQIYIRNKPFGLINLLMFSV